MSAVVVVQVGQCGNQLGAVLWSLLRRHCEGGPGEGTRGNVFYSSGGKARAVLVDSEPKVLQQIIAQDSFGQFRSDNVVADQSGRGNNWAMGYFGPQLAKAPSKAAGKAP
eukprot:RCo036352